jgi:CBS domain-containing protein
MGGIVMYEFTHYQVRDVMTSKTITVDQGATLLDVEIIFDRHDFNGIPVIDAGSRLIGMVTKLDILKAFAFTKRVKIPKYDSIMLQPVSEIMIQTIDVFDPETPLTRVLHRMIETGYKSFPVIEGDRVVGIIAREDILRALRRAALGQFPSRLASSDMKGMGEASNF